MSSVRERYEGTSNNEPSRAVTTDHATSTWGTLSVTNRIENARQVSYLLTCSCGATGQRVTQQELASGTTPICRLCHGTGNAPGDTTRQRTAGEAGVQERIREDIVFSPRQRAEMKQRAEEQKQWEEESNG